MAEPSKCRSCGAPIVWATTSNGKLAPFDAKPIGVTDLKSLGDGTYLAGETRRGYVSHFATCPQSKTWRKEKKRSEQPDALERDADREMVGEEDANFFDYSGFRR